MYAKTLAHIGENPIISRLLVFNDLLDCAHGALFNTVAASDAGLFVYNLAYAVYNLDAFLGASVDANAAANALFGFKHRMSHCVLLSLVYSASTLKINTDKNSNRHPAGSNH